MDSFKNPAINTDDVGSSSDKSTVDSFFQWATSPKIVFRASVALASVAVICTIIFFVDYVKLGIAFALNWIQRAGLWYGSLVLALMIIIQALLFLPCLPFTLGAGFLYGVTHGSIVVHIASTIAAFIGFVLSRYIARSFLERKLVSDSGDSTWKKIDKAIEQDGFKLVFLIRFSPLHPYGLCNYLFGLTSVSLKDYMLASFFGMMPTTVVEVYFGTALKSFADILGDSSSASDTNTNTNSDAGGSTDFFFWFGLFVTLAVTIYMTYWLKKKLNSHLDEYSVDEYSADEYSIEEGADNRELHALKSSSVSHSLANDSDLSEEDGLPKLDGPLPSTSELFNTLPLSLTRSNLSGSSAERLNTLEVPTEYAAFINSNSSNALTTPRSAPSATLVDRKVGDRVGDQPSKLISPLSNSIVHVSVYSNNSEYTISNNTTPKNTTPKNTVSNHTLSTLSTDQTNQSINISDNGPLSVKSVPQNDLLVVNEIEENEIDSEVVFSSGNRDNTDSVHSMNNVLSNNPVSPSSDHMNQSYTHNDNSYESNLHNVSVSTVHSSQIPSDSLPSYSHLTIPTTVSTLEFDKPPHSDSHLQEHFDLPNIHPQSDLDYVTALNESIGSIGCDFEHEYVDNNFTSPHFYASDDVSTNQGDNAYHNNPTIHQDNSDYPVDQEINDSDGDFTDDFNDEFHFDDPVMNDLGGFVPMYPTHSTLTLPNPSEPLSDDSDGFDHFSFENNAQNQVNGPNSVFTNSTTPVNDHVSLLSNGQIDDLVAFDDSFDF